MSKAGTDRRLPARVSSVGAGNMAEAILRGLIRAGAEPDGLSAADPLLERRELLSRELGISTTASNAEVGRNADLVLLAVKPGSLAEATAELPGAPGPIYLSIVAGATLETLAQLLGWIVHRAPAVCPATGYFFETITKIILKIFFVTFEIEKC